MNKTQNAKRKTQNEQNLSSKSSSEPVTMEELLAQTGYQPKGLKKGGQVEGVISSIGPHEILIDIKGKTEGIVLERDKKLFKELLSQLSLGDTVKAVVISPESENGHAVLSLRRELMDKNWNTLAQAKEKAEEVEVAGIELTRGGLLVDVLGLRGFIPLSHLDPSEGGAESLVGIRFKAKVLDLDRKEHRIVLSQKGARISDKKLKALLDKLEIGKEYQGTVSGITNFGIFVKIHVEQGEDVEGLVHISEISWEKVEDVAKMFKLDDSVNVLMIGIDKDNMKLNLSLKKLTTDPWEEVANKYAKDQTVTGRISKVSSFGLFVSLEEGIEGLIHKSKIPQDKQYNAGDKIECVVESVDSGKRRIALAPLLKEKPVGYR